MALADQIRDLANQIHADLRAGHDYFEHATFAWRLVQTQVGIGDPFLIRNLDTGTVVRDSELVALSHSYVTGYLAESVFQHYVSLFEDFTFGLIGAWLLAYPKGISRGDEREDRVVSLDVIFEAVDKEAIIRVVVDRELDKLKYKRLAVWFEYLNKRVKLGLPSEDQIPRLAEIKASRDILVHNRGLVNETYRDKAGDQARYAVGERLEIQEPYLRASWQLISEVVQELTIAALAKT